jgi:hypothetical protein
VNGEEIRRRLVDFARKWSLYDGSERAEAQTFLNEPVLTRPDDSSRALPGALSTGAQQSRVHQHPMSGGGEQPELPPEPRGCG